MAKLDPATAAHLRMQCLGAAQRTFDGMKDGEIVLRTAREYTDFVLGTNDAGVIRAARSLAKAVENSDV